MKNKIERVKRFSKLRILEHFTHIIIFLIMFVTGFTQKYYNLDISVWFISKMGGIENVYIIHHIFGIIFIILFIYSYFKFLLLG